MFAYICKLERFNNLLVTPLGFGCWKDKVLENVTLGIQKLWWALFMIFWHFIDLINWLVGKAINRLIWTWISYYNHFKLRPTYICTDQYTSSTVFFFLLKISVWHYTFHPNLGEISAWAQRSVCCRGKWGSAFKGSVKHFDKCWGLLVPLSLQLADLKNWIRPNQKYIWIVSLPQGLRSKHLLCFI